MKFHNSSEQYSLVYRKTRTKQNAAQFMKIKPVALLGP